MKGDGSCRHGRRCEGGGEGDGRDRLLVVGDACGGPEGEGRHRPHLLDLGRRGLLQLRVLEAGRPLGPPGATPSEEGTGRHGRHESGVLSVAFVLLKRNV